MAGPHSKSRARRIKPARNPVTRGGAAQSHGVARAAADEAVRTLLRCAGEDPQRLMALPAWREVAFYTERERAALQWAESLTLLPETGAPDEHFDALRPHFSDKEIAELSFSIAQINAWNRLGVGMRVPVARKPLVAA